MKVRPKPIPAPKDKPSLNAPKRGGVRYWFYIVLAAFFFPIAFMSVIIMILMEVIAPTFDFIGFIIAPCIAFFIARKVHRHLLNLPDKEYEKCFQRPCRCYRYENDSIDSGSPIDRGSSSYWTMGRGHSSHNH